MKQEREKQGASAQQVKFLKKIAFFQDFDDHELKQLLNVSRWLKVPQGTLVIKEDTMEKVFYILVKGHVSVFITLDGGKTMELTTLQTGDTFGEMALVSETRRTAGVKTTSECFILMVEPDILNHASVFLQLKFYRRFCEILVTRLIAANKRMSDLSATTPGPPAKAKQAVEKPAPAKSRPAPPRATPSAGRESREPATPPPSPSATSDETVLLTPEVLTGEADLSDLPPVPKVKVIAKGKIRRRIQGNLELAINPIVAARLSAFLVGDCEDTRKFADLISCDPMLSAKILQMANSSFYRRTAAVTTVPHAMVTMGIKHIQELVGEESMKIVREDILFGGYSQLAAAFWQHAVTVGSIAELLKETIRLNVPEDVYLAGLFHDLGKLALDMQEPDFYPQLLRPGFLKSPISDLETEFAGTDHGHAGFWLGEKMGLPKAYQDVMLHHHTPEKARDNVLIVALIHLADLFAKERGVIQGAPEPEPVDIHTSFGWILVQEKHTPFIDVNIDDFIKSFNAELDRSWSEICSLLPS